MIFELCSRATLELNQVIKILPRKLPYNLMKNRNFLAESG